MSKVFQDQVAESNDRRQQIVEVMGDSARQDANCLHLLRLAKLLLELPSVGNVFGYANNSGDNTSGVANRISDIANPTRRSIRTDDLIRFVIRSLSLPLKSMLDPATIIGLNSLKPHAGIGVQRF